jgi:hypothetical protein
MVSNLVIPPVCFPSLTGFGASRLRNDPCAPKNAIAISIVVDSAADAVVYLASRLSSRRCRDIRRFVLET